MTPESDDLLARLPRHRAPAELRVAILGAATPAPSRGRTWWWAPTLSAAATAMAMALLWISVLPRVVPADPTQRLVRAVVSEHTRNLIWGEPKPEIIPAAQTWLWQETGIWLSHVLADDQELTAVAGEPIYVEGRRGVAIHYRDAEEHLVSYIVIPAPSLALPDQRRVQIDRYRPVLWRRSEGFAVLAWKHGELACFLVSDMVSEADLARFKTYFVRIRQTTEPYLTH